jgi:NitT/TauT family transport system substrate-binding protein
MQKYFTTLFILISLVFPLSSSAKKADINALYIPLADHYAALVAYERYGKKMKHANYKLKQMKNWDLLRAYFQSGKADMAYSMTPLAIDMYNEKPHFQWIGLMHRDGNALAVNNVLEKQLSFNPNRIDRKPNQELADVLKKMYHENNRATQVGLPHLLSSHAVVLYRYLKEHNSTITFSPNHPGEVLGISLAPPKAPSFIKRRSVKATPAAIEQSLPWADIVETTKAGKLAWYSKDIMPWKHGHVECIALATKKAIKKKKNALKEVMYYIHKAGSDIEIAKAKGGKALNAIVSMVRKHIPSHTKDAIIASLNKDLNVINYNHLNIDKEGLKLILDYALEGKILNQGLDIDKFANDDFNIELK